MSVPFSRIHSWITDTNTDKRIKTWIHGYKHVYTDTNTDTRINGYIQRYKNGCKHGYIHGYTDTYTDKKRK